MDQTDIADRLTKLLEELGAWSESQPAKPLLPAAAPRPKGHLKNSGDPLQDTLDYLRICIKYQLFDLEATRRENRYLRRLLEEKQQ